MKRLLVLSLLLIVSDLAMADESRAEARLSLKKWGLAYCMESHSPDAQGMAGSAMGAYFEHGSHDNEMAYENVRHFFDSNYRSVASQSKTASLAFMECLDIYESRAYRKLILDQDRYIEKATRHLQPSMDSSQPYP